MSTREDDINELHQWFGRRRTDRRRSELRESRSFALAAFGVFLIVMALLFAHEAGAESWTLTCPAPTQRTDDTAITQPLAFRFYWGRDKNALQVVEVPQAPCKAVIQVPDPAPGASVTYYLTASAIEAGRQSAQSPMLTKTITGAPPEQRLVVVETAVYNTGTFDTLNWMVKRNRLYGTVPLGTECLETRPAVGGYYRVPTTAVKWANPLARTPFPLARCERKA